MIQGIIREIRTRPWNNKTMYTLVLVNDNQFYGLGTFKPQANLGDFVEFQAAKNEKGYWQADKDTLKVITSPEGAVVGTPATQVQSQTTASYRPAGKSQDEKDFWGKKEKREIRNDDLRSLGAARNTAIEWVKFLVEKEAIPVVTKAAGREEALNAVLDDYTKKFMRGIVEGPAGPSVTEATKVVSKKTGKLNGNGEAKEVSPVIEIDNNEPAWE
jgi:hypothetical protein